MTFDHTSGHRGPAMLTDKFSCQSRHQEALRMCVQRSLVGQLWAFSSRVTGHQSGAGRPLGQGRQKTAFPRQGERACVSQHISQDRLPVASWRWPTGVHVSANMKTWRVASGSRAGEQQGRRQNLREYPASCPRVLPGCPGSRPTVVMG